jgi:hypothetical protein
MVSTPDLEKHRRQDKMYNVFTIIPVGMKYL